MDERVIYKKLHPDPRRHNKVVSIIPLTSDRESWMMLRNRGEAVHRFANGQEIWAVRNAAQAAARIKHAVARTATDKEDAEEAKAVGDTSARTGREQWQSAAHQKRSALTR